MHYFCIIFLILHELVTCLLLKLLSKMYKRIKCIISVLFLCLFVHARNTKYRDTRT